MVALINKSTIRFCMSVIYSDSKMKKICTEIKMNTLHHDHFTSISRRNQPFIKVSLNSDLTHMCKVSVKTNFDEKFLHL